MDFTAGDRIEVTSNVLGVQPRLGSVLASTGNGGLRVRWDDGHETVFFPASNCRVVASGDPAGAGLLRLGLHVDVNVVEEDDECRATATVATSRGPLRADGTAHRKPADPQIPMVGEELAIGRALVDLGEQLISAATADMSMPPSARAHLVN